MRLPNKARVVTAGLCFAFSIPVPEPAPMILQIYRDPLQPGHEATFKLLEEDAARICAELNCPNPHLAIESLSGPKEVWWLNAYVSEADKQRVADAYANNKALLTALARITERRKGVVGTSVDVFANYRADLSRGARWQVAGIRFFVITVTKGDPTTEGSVFEGPDGTRFIFRPARTRQDADALAATAGAETTIFAVRPYWGMPAKEWIAADPEFWTANPMVRARRP